ncbi:MAG TPA: hypothetical protein VFE12_20030, partial [Acetobacteraceae bacterium]|nr:hypothetical protein [Acetobacteraceae bacterium]
MLATIAVALLLIGIGRVVERLSPTGVSELAAPAAWLITGWAVAALAGALCAAGGIALAWPAALLGVTGMGGYCIGVPRGPLLKLAAAWLIVAPLLLIASTIPPTMFDEFAQWLPNTRFLVEHGRFPDAAAPNIWSAKPAYPPAIPIIGYAVQTVSGHGAELAAKIFSVLLAASFGLTLAGLLRTRLGLPLALAVGVAFATVADPFFDPRVSL